jgi:hypothetical protein
VKPEYLALGFSGLLVMFSIFTYWRSGAWRSQDARDAERAGTSGRIERVDSNARSEIGRIERELKERIAGVEAAQALSLMGFSERLARVEEQIKHLPTGEQMDRMIERLGGVEGEVKALLARSEAQTELTRTIRDHIMLGERS